MVRYYLGEMVRYWLWKGSGDGEGQVLPGGEGQVWPDGEGQLLPDGEGNTTLYVSMNFNSIS